MAAAEDQTGLKVYASIPELAEAVCQRLQLLAAEASSPRHVSLAGGTTPKVIFQMLAERYRETIDWSLLHFWWGDERLVSSDQPQSNYGEAYRMLFQMLVDDGLLPRENLHPIKPRLGAEQACIQYLQEMKRHIPFRHELPCYDLILLGIGEEGHTASLFPNDISIDCRTWTAIGTIPHSGEPRITITYRIINNAREVDFVVTGDQKREVIRNIFLDHHKALRYPALYIKPEDGECYWYLDRDAAADLVSLLPGSATRALAT